MSIISLVKNVVSISVVWIRLIFLFYICISVSIISMFSISRRISMFVKFSINSCIGICCFGWCVIVLLLLRLFMCGIVGSGFVVIG